MSGTVNDSWIRQQQPTGRQECHNSNTKVSLSTIDMFESVHDSDHGSAVRIFLAMQHRNDMFSLFLIWCTITPQQLTHIAPPKATPICYICICRCHACLQFGRVLPICRKSGHVSTTLMNEPQHLLLWKGCLRIGSTVTQSKKTKWLHMYVFLEMSFSISVKLMRSCSSSDQETCWG